MENICLIFTEDEKNKSLQGSWEYVWSEQQQALKFSHLCLCITSCGCVVFA